MMEGQQAAFEQLPLARTSLADVLSGQYRVYKDRSSFSMVTAESALQALELSGFGHAYKIERHSAMAHNLINPAYWEAPKPTETTEAQAAPETPAVEATAPAAPSAPETTAPAGDAPLSNNDVDKLLNG